MSAPAGLPQFLGAVARRTSTSSDISEDEHDHQARPSLQHARTMSDSEDAKRLQQRGRRGHRNSIVQYIDAERRHQQEVQTYLHQKRMGSLTDTQQRVIFLPRGGTYVNTNCGPVQFGIPPETIKDSMKLGLTLPTNYVLPKQRFNLQMGMNVAEFEFPAYYNFFVKRRRVNIITTRDVEPLVRTIFKETLLGPSHVEFPTEFSTEVPREAYPDLMKEMSFFRVNPFDKTELTVDSLLQFTFFEEGVAKLPDGVEIRDEGEEYVVIQNEKEYARVSSHVLLSPPAVDDVKENEVEHFVPPHFGVTMLGNSDGFDAKGTTTGFVLWMNRRGIMVDPPPHSGTILKKHGISARLMRGIILTHCHADHDAGTFQKILEEGRVVVMTTEVILNSFLLKYSSISGLDVDFLKKLFIYRPITIGERTAVYGGALQFFYSLHSIPCVGFAAYCNGKSMVYSGDTFNDPAGIRKLYDMGLMTAERRDKLLNFQWHHDLILHEAGVPPIHTPMTTFEPLSDDIKKRLYIVHKPSKDVPHDKGLKSALVGPENTIVISNSPGPNASALEVLDLLGSIDLFASFVISRGLEIVECATFLKFNPGDTVVQEGTHGHTLYVIAMGSVAISSEGNFIKHLTVGDHFGEMSIVTGEKRTATIRAVTPLEVIQFSKNEFLYIVRRTNAIERLKQLGVMQRSKSWQIMSSNSVLGKLSSSQKTYLQTILQKRTVKAGEALWHTTGEATEAVLIADGQFVFSRAQDMTPFCRGAFVGDMAALMSDTPLTTTLLCSQSGSVYYVNKKDLLKFFDDNPGFKVFFLDRRFVE